MPPKHRPEQYDKNAPRAGSRSGNNRNSSRPSLGPSPLGKSSISNSEICKSIAQWRLPKNATASDYKSKIEGLWKTMGNSRVGERQNAIKHGLMADPNKRTTLANAIRVVGTCEDMCPEFERIQRIRENAVDRAEKVTTHNGSKVADEYRMVKAFHRPDAGKEEQLPSDLRSPVVLQKTVRYLLDKVASPGASLAEHHKFVWDRTRCIRNDFTIQASSRLEDIKIAIECYEDIARFHILSLHQMPKIGKHDYDAQQELEQLSATLLTLFEYYDDNRGKYEAPREAEFRAYKLLIDIRSRTNDTLERVQTWPRKVQTSSQVQIAVQLYQASGKVFTDTGSMLSPYSRSLRVEQAQYAKFWSILESPKVDYLMACAASVSFNEVRARTLETLAKVYRSGPQSKLQDISLNELTYTLGLDSKTQTRKLLRETGLSLSRHTNGSTYLDLDETPGPVPKVTIAASDQIFSRSIVEVKREGRLFRAVYRGLEVKYCRENGLIDENLADGDFEPDPEDMESDEGEEESLFVAGNEDELAEPPTDTSLTPVNPSGTFGRASPGLDRRKSATPEPPPVALGAFGQPSGVQASGLTNGFAANPFAKPSTMKNPFADATKTAATTSVAIELPKTGFGQAPGLFQSFGSPSNESKPKVKTAAVPSSGSSQTLSTEPSQGTFQWKPPGTTSLRVFAPVSSGISSIESTSTLESMAQSIPREPQRAAIAAVELGKTVDSELKKPLYPFTFPTATLPASGATNTTTTAAPTFFSTVKPITETKSIFSTAPPITTKPGNTEETLSSLSIKPSSPTASASLVETTKKEGSSLSAPTLITSNVQPSRGDSNSQKPGLFQSASPVMSPSSSSISPGSKLRSDAQLAAVTPAAVPSITKDQRDVILSRISKELLLGPYGLLEQFVEAEMGSIYDKARREVVKERTQVRLEEIKTSVLGTKYLIKWKQTIDEKVRRREIKERRSRLRQSCQEQTSRERSASLQSDLIHEIGDHTQSTNSLGHLTRGFHDTFDKSVSGQQEPSTAAKSGASNVTMGETTTDSPRNSTHQRNHHSRSQTVDGTFRMSSNAPSSSSMPPPNRPPNLKSSASQPRFKPFIGSGILQNEALRREALEFARKSGSTTTTRSDYFRLKARGIDPDTPIFPSTRKRGRDSGDGIAGDVVTKSRRVSDSSTSTVSLSESTRALLARSKLSESTRSLLNGQSPAPQESVNGTITLRYTEEEDALFAAARKLRQTLADDTDWMRTMREGEEQKDASIKAETPAQRRLREFKFTPSKTSIRLRETHANGLLPPDYFDKARHGSSRGAEVRKNSNVLDTPTPRMGLGALPNDRKQRPANNPTESYTSGASADDAIEL